MKTGSKHLKLIKRFYKAEVGGLARPNIIKFYLPTSDKSFNLEKAKYICFIKDSAYIIDFIKAPNPFYCIDTGGALKKNLNSSSMSIVIDFDYQQPCFIDPTLLILNFSYISESYINKLNDVEKFDYFGLLRKKYMDLESRTTGLYLIKGYV